MQFSNMIQFTKKKADKSAKGTKEKVYFPHLMVVTELPVPKKKNEQKITYISSAKLFLLLRKF